MNPIKHRFTLDMHSAQSQISIPALLGDTGRELHITLTDGENSYTITDGCLALIRIKRPDESYLMEGCDILNNTTLVYPFSRNPNTCRDEGIHECEIALYGPDEEVIATPRFTMVVSERVISSDDVNITDEDKTAIDLMITAEASRQAAETGRVNAEASRQTAETARADAETAREKAFNDLMNGVTELPGSDECTAVEANPEGEPEEHLNTVKIADTVYCVGNAHALALENGYSGTLEEFGKKLAELLGMKIYDGGAGDVDSDFPIYSGSTGDVEAHIIFYINDTEYLARRGMTFAEWVESADNKGGWFVYEDDGIRDSDNAVLQLDGVDVKAADTIADGAHYESMGG